MERICHDFLTRFPASFLPMRVPVKSFAMIHFYFMNAVCRTFARFSIVFLSPCRRSKFYLLISCIYVPRIIFSLNDYFLINYFLFDQLEILRLFPY